MAYPGLMALPELTRSQRIRYYVLVGTIALNLFCEVWKVLLHVGP